MISLNRVYAIFLRYIISVRNGDMWRIIEALYWPVLDVLLLGSIGFLTQTSAEAAPFRALLATAALWPMTIAANYEIAVNLLNEIWEENFVPLFATPLKLIEWMLGVMATGVLRALIVLPVTVGLVLFSFKCNLFSYALVPLVTLLIMNGWAIGFIAAGCIVYWGERIQQLAWMVGWGMAVVSAIFCPIEALNPWVYAVSKHLPLTQAFQVVKLYYRDDILSWGLLRNTFLMTIIFLSISMAFFMYMFEKSRNKGFK